MSDTTRKPLMSEDRRKILNLLEYILEVNTDIKTVYEVFIAYVAQKDEAIIRWQSDETWAQWFEEYAEKLSKTKETNDVDSTGV